MLQVAPSESVAEYQLMAHIIHQLMGPEEMLQWWRWCLAGRDTLCAAACHPHPACHQNK